MTVGSILKEKVKAMFNKQIEKDYQALAESRENDIQFPLRLLRRSKPEQFKRAMKKRYNHSHYQKSSQGRLKMEQEYVLAYGFRRYSACKKLGWKTIPSYIVEQKKTIDLPIEKIFVTDNTRLQGFDENFEELMTSIKHNGLLQPIGVWEGKNLSEEDFLVLNLTENIHRQDISPMELAKAIKTLQELGLTFGQIAIRLALPKSKIISIADVQRRLPKHIMSEMSFLDKNRKDKTGKLPFSVVKSVANLRVTKADQMTIIDEAKKEELSLGDIEVIGRLISKGLPASKSIQQKDKYKRLTLTLVIDKKRWEKAKYPFSQGIVIEKMLTGKLPLNPKLFFVQKK